MKQIPLGMRLQDRAVFESFHAAGGAQAVAWLQGLAQPQGHGMGWVQGPPGSGKSHLLQAVCARVPGSAYFPLRELASMGPEVLDGSEGLACICVDDVDQVVGQAGWEAALFRVWVGQDAQRGRLVLAAATPAALLPFGLPDLASRLASATACVLHRLDEDQQREALRLRAQLRGLELPEDTALWLQRRYPRGMDTLLGLLDTLDVASLAQQRRLTLPFIRQVLGPGSPDA